MVYSNLPLGVMLCTVYRQRGVRDGHERARLQLYTRVEEFGRVELQDAEAAALVRSKVVHMVLLVVVVLMGVASGDKRGLPGPFLAFWLAGVAEAVVMPGTGAAEKAKGVGKATAAFVLGMFVLGTLMAFGF
jgi:hypothetical protein